MATSSRSSPGPTEVVPDVRPLHHHLAARRPPWYHRRGVRAIRTTRHDPEILLPLRQHLREPLHCPRARRCPLRVRGHRLALEPPELAALWGRAGANSKGEAWAARCSSAANAYLHQGASWPRNWHGHTAKRDEVHNFPQTVATVRHSAREWSDTPTANPNHEP